MENLDQEADDPDSIWCRRKDPKSTNSKKSINTNRPQGIRRVKSETGAAAKALKGGRSLQKELINKDRAERELGLDGAGNVDTYTYDASNDVSI